MNWINVIRILLISAALSGYSVWVLAHRDRGPTSSAGYAVIDDIPLLRQAEAETHWHKASTVFIDTRSSIDFQFGHIAGAISMPEEECEKLLPDLKPKLERAGALVVYCKSEDCGKSLWTAIRLHQAGLKQVRIYPAGWNEWVLSKLPVEGSAR
jgi:rhodanese-related sulfurtransferase